MKCVDFCVPFFFWVIIFYFFITNIFSLFYNILCSKAFEIVTYILISLYNLFIIYYTILYILAHISDRTANKITIPISIAIPIFLLIYIAELIILSINLMKFKEFRKECPFNIKFNENYEKRCELFNINTNSRYKYQYICSYDASTDFSLSKKIANNEIICVKAKTPINYIVSKNIANNLSNNIYYCSRTDIPFNSTYINIKYCNNNIGYKRVIIFYVFYCLLFFLPFIEFCASCMFLIELSNIERHIERREIGRIRENNVLPIIAVNLMADFFLRNNNDTRSSINISHNSNINNNISKEKTRNIIIENKKEIEINTNIQQSYINKDNKKEKVSFDNIITVLNNNNENRKINN